MLRFLTFVAFLGILYSIYQIITQSADTVVAANKVAPTGEGKTLTKEDRTPVTGPAGVAAIPYAKRPIVYLFTGRSWCPPCRTLDAKVLSTPEWKFLALHQVVYKEVVLPPDFSRASKLNRDLVAKYGIQSVPTMVVVSPSGSEMGRRPGAGTGAAAYVKWVRDIAGITPHPQVAANP